LSIIIDSLSNFARDILKTRVLKHCLVDYRVTEKSVAIGFLERNRPGALLAWCDLSITNKGCHLNSVQFNGIIEFSNPKLIEIYKNALIKTMEFVDEDIEK